MSKKILVVDDEPFVLRSLTYVLAKNGYEAFTARDGEEALKLLQKVKPDIMFLDVMMPKCSGYEVLRRIRENPEFDSIYIIMLSAKSQERDREKSLALGANEFMTKPFSPSRILQRIQEILTNMVGENG